MSVEPWWTHLPLTEAAFCALSLVLALCVVFLAIDALIKRRRGMRRARLRLQQMTGVPLSPRISRSWLRVLRGPR